MPRRDQADDDPRSEDRPHPKSRLIGGLLVFLGLAMVIAVAGGAADSLPGRMFGLVVGLASGGLWIGLGLRIIPPTHRDIARIGAENNAMLAFKLLPPLWKAWLVMALLITAGVFIGALILRDERNTIVLPAR